MSKLNILLAELNEVRPLVMTSGAEYASVPVVTAEERAVIAIDARTTTPELMPA